MGADTCSVQIQHVPLYADTCLRRAFLDGSELIWALLLMPVAQQYVMLLWIGSKSAIMLCALQELSGKLTNQLTDLTSMVRRDLGGEARKKVNTLIITDVHARDIIETFVRDSVMDAREFAWESQLRFYWDRTADDLMVRQCTGQRIHIRPC